MSERKMGVSRTVTVALLPICMVVLTGCGGGQSDETRRTDSSESQTTEPLSVPSEEPPAEHLDRIVELFNLGVGLMDQYRAVEAVDAFDEVVRLAPHWPTGRVNLGIALLNATGDSRYARAEEEFRRVITLDENNAYAHYTLGMLLRHLTRFEEAKAHFKEVLRIDPGDADAHYQLAVLIMGSEPEAAMEHLEETLRKVPHHESACYRLQGLLRKAGQAQRAGELLARFQALKRSAAGVTLGMRYGEMGRYANVIRALIDTDVSAGLNTPIVFNDVADQLGLTPTPRGAAGWPADAPASDVSFGPGVAVVDCDGDGDLDVYFPGLGPKGQGVLFNGDGRQFSEAASTGIDGRGAVGAYFGDYDADGDPDLYLTCKGPNRLYRIDGGNAPTVGAIFFDFDGDRDLDLYLVNHRAANRLFLNDRVGRYHEATDRFRELADDGPGLGALVGDVDLNGHEDLLLLRGKHPPRLLLQIQRGRFVEDAAFAAVVGDLGGAVAAVFG